MTFRAGPAFAAPSHTARCRTIYGALPFGFARCSGAKNARNDDEAPAGPAAAVETFRPWKRSASRAVAFCDRGARRRGRDIIHTPAPRRRAGLPRLINDADLPYGFCRVRGAFVSSAAD